MKIYRIVFALCVISFITPNFALLFGKIGFYARYGTLCLLVPATIIYATRRHIKVPPGILATFYLFASYALLTAFWTENAKLSVIKWIIYVPLCISLLVGGILVGQQKDKNPFWPMRYIFGPIVLLSVAALVRGFGWLNGNFHGYCGNSNALGATLMLTSPWLIIELRDNWSRSRYRMVLVSLAVAAAIVMLATFSRAALGGEFIIVCAAGWGLHLGRKVLVGYVLVGMLIFVYVVRPNSYAFLYESYVEKSSQPILKSRTGQLEDSWEAARKGGVFGAGFGVSVGASRYWNMESFSTYSREKGNSMLAIIEEVGVAGFVLYLALLFAIWGSLRQLSRSSDPDQKYLYKLTVGFFVGALFHSAFEAWFLSSGPDIAVFWATLGLSIGALNVYSRTPNERFAHMEAAVRPRVLVHPSISQR